MIVFIKNGLKISLIQRRPLLTASFVIYLLWERGGGKFVRYTEYEKGPRYLPERSKHLLTSNYCSLVKSGLLKTSTADY